MNLIPFVLIVLLCGVGAARLPNVGDKVQMVAEGNGPFEKLSLTGIVTDIDDTFICLNVNYMTDFIPNGNFTELYNSTKADNICIGKKSINRIGYI